MNLLDMHTREKANKIHLDEMHQQAKVRHLLRQATQAGTNEGRLSRRKFQRMFARVALLILFGHAGLRL